MPSHFLFSPFRGQIPDDLEMPVHGGPTRLREPGSLRKTPWPSRVQPSNLFCQLVNILGLVGHIQSLPHILFGGFVGFCNPLKM